MRDAANQVENPKYKSQNLVRGRAQKPWSRLLFVLNNRSGTQKTDRRGVIESWVRSNRIEADYMNLEGSDVKEMLEKKITAGRPDVLVAVGGDGTVSFTADVCMKFGLPLAIVPAGSANGMARELDIPEDCESALALLATGTVKQCDVVRVNDRWMSLHLCDMGLNARMVKYFDGGPRRGFIGYGMAMVKALRNKRRLKVTFEAKGGPVAAEAVMVIVANASKYGTGATINPEGSIDDGLFEVVIVKKLSVVDLLKMFFRPGEFNPRRIEIFHARSATVETNRPSHFQVDGEYIGKLTSFTAKNIHKAIGIVVPAVSPV
jgi:diacylglycerol kinase (ATP)